MVKIVFSLLTKLAMRLLTGIICCLFFLPSVAQTVDSRTVKLSEIFYFDTIAGKCLVHLAEKQSVPSRSIAGLPYQEPIYRKTVTDRNIEKEWLVRFTIFNDADTAKEYYFVPGYFVKDIEIYEQLSDSSLRQLPPDSLSAKLFEKTRLMRLEGKETKTFFSRFNYIRSNINTYNPRLIERDFLGPWVLMVKNTNGYMSIMTYIAIGVMILMLIYSLALFIQNQNTEFLYYSAYAASIAVMIFLKTFLSFKPGSFNTFFEEYLDFMFLVLGVFFYLGFIRRFLNTGKREPFLEKLIRYVAILLTLLFGIFSYFYFLTDSYVILNILENNVIKVLMFVLSVIVIIYSFRKKDPLLNYLAAGNIALISFSMLSLAMIVFRWKPFPDLQGSILNSSMFYYEIGLILELMFFLFGLAYKNKKDIISQVREREQLRLENERREFDKQMAIMAARQDERDRISADMHDDLGSGVTAIRLMSEIVKSKLQTTAFPEIDRISESANELLGKMNSIIWTMKSSNDSVESLNAYLRAYATEYFDNTPVSCHVTVQEMVDQELSGEKRRNIFLSFKEMLNNILKHAHATEVRIAISCNRELLRVEIHDNGVGIDMEKIRRFGNGLGNIRKRLQSINGSFLIEKNHGTRVVFEIALDRK